MIKFYYKASDCPEHPGEQLKTENLMITTIDNEIIPFDMAHYCPQSKKYLSYGNKLVLREESALEVANRNNFNKKTYKLSEIEVITLKEFIKKRKENQNTNL